MLQSGDTEWVLFYPLELRPAGAPYHSQSIVPATLGLAF